MYIYIYTYTHCYMNGIIFTHPICPGRVHLDVGGLQLCGAGVGEFLRASGATPLRLPHLLSPAGVLWQ